MWSHSVPFSCVVSEKHVISTEQREILGKRQIQFSVLTVIDLFSCLINFNFVAIQHLLSAPQVQRYISQSNFYYAEFTSFWPYFSDDKN